ncbi:hypothetical protein K466DRAFT_265456 [Polyporus arcularius HHB13444]|uniref:Uncharacterized protein n=1 Tax=Polyporus arcularius HHB13444 TaxID=1314778 RepID=A0A5C3PUE6_9APHY|nr:hypothetical protein K466DRAFT_265456 [Polyporus arcularius HHB13444]
MKTPAASVLDILRLLARATAYDTARSTRYNQHEYEYIATRQHGDTLIKQDEYSHIDSINRKVDCMDGYRVSGMNVDREMRTPEHKPMRP